MYKKSLVFVLICIICFLIYVLNIYAQETLTITTYYPSPYGSYNELSTNKLAVGYTAAADQPTNVGDIRLLPRAALGSPGKAGEIAISNVDYSLYVSNGISWVPQSGGDTCVVTYNSAVGSCSCPSGWTLKKDLGSWGACGPTSSNYTFFRPPGGACPSGWFYLGIGEGCFCCSS